MSTRPYTNNAQFHQPTSDPKLQLARSIARYHLFDFLNSDRAASDLLPLVESVLPLDIRKTTVKLMNKRRSWKKRAMHSFVGGVLPVLAPVLGTVGDVLQFPGTVLLNTLKELGSNEILTDTNWGSTTVKTQSYGGDLAWFTKVSIGTPSQEFRLNIDSGSADLFLFGSKCKSCSLSNHTAYYPEKSKTFPFVYFHQAVKFFQTFGDGSTVGGSLAVDVLQLGGSVRVSNQTFGLASSVSSDWAASPVDGLMGIGPDSLSILTANHSKGVFTQLIASKTLVNPIIGIALVKQREQKADSPAGEFTFGDVSEKWIAGGRKALIWKNVTSHNFWGIELTGVYVNGFNAMSSDDSPRAILDTGTSLTLVSEATAAAIHKRIPGSAVDPGNGLWRIPCSIHNANNTMQSSAYDNEAPVASNSKVASTPKKESLSKLFRREHTTPPTSYLHHMRESQFGTRSTRISSPSSPNVIFEFGAGGSRFAIPAEDLAYQGLGSGNTSNDLCYSGIQTGSQGFVVLGDTFIKNIYLALRDGPNGQKSVGLGRRADLPLFK
ncbi:hypothetical protein CROQUDRAFT_56133 [Cronartium quercuum f. sp. fusiforme G11]|uniref:Peptidase A1 domain-containing protein n=1 Tax=Cronartium quercuum f. sp. fusiforme G11 TaxID=708437 RepID=A0A9P6NRQ4_9BASI|nr:hypothetical protein CROQUDRAFT_56133 [Cronartium quercuum f. sp. fusiforme G11]